MARDHTIAKLDTLQDGQMKSVEIDENTTLLLIRLKGQYHVYGGTCPHHGAPLGEGLLKDGHVRCPWHQAVFDALTGELEEPPALDSLPKFDVRVEGDDVIVTLPDEVPTARPMRMARPDPATDGRRFVIVGSGAAGFAAAETLRQDGFQGRIEMLTLDDFGPYDRTELSKQYLAKPDAASKPFVRRGDYYPQIGVDLRTGVKVTGVDADRRTVSTMALEEIACDGLLLATGSTPRTLDVEGAELGNIFLLRTLADCEEIRQAADKAKRAVIVGSSFIGMEVASSLSRWGVSSTIVSPEQVPFAKTLGERIGRMYRALHEENGVSFRPGRKVKRFDGDENDSVRTVELDDGERIDADMVVIGIGVRQGVHEILQHPAVSDRGTVKVDEQLRVAEGLWAAGDIAVWPDWRTGEPIRIEHWRVAMQLGRWAAHSMAGRGAPFRGVPFFWTSQFKTIVQYVGHASDYDEVVFDGSPEDRQFVACYVKAGQVHAVAGCKESLKMDIAAEAIREKGLLTVDELRAAMKGA